MQILLIEPDKKLGETYKHALEKAGHRVELVAHAQDAVYTADTTRPELVILELQLAGHNGIEFLHEFRSYPEWQGIGVLLLTMVPPHSLQISQEMMDSFGIVGALYKPATTLKQLIRTIDEVV